MEVDFEGEVPNGYNLKNAYRTGKVFLYIKADNNKALSKYTFDCLGD
jgi:hypothetical protein